jgi:hypothetical protein
MEIAAPDQHHVGFDPAEGWSMTMSLIASGTRSWRRCNWGDELCRAF